MGTVTRLSLFQQGYSKFADQDIRGDQLFSGIVFTDHIVRVDKVIQGNSSNYSRLVADPRVFIADVTATLAFREMQARGLLGGLTWDAYASQVQIHAPITPFWQMENLGLDKFNSRLTDVICGAAKLSNAPGQCGPGSSPLS